MGLAKGYMNNPGLTEKKFIANPDPKSVYNRLYKSGDLVRRLDNGEIEYIDRIDNYTKVRGVFIDTGEIENVLLLHKNIVESVVKVITINDVKYIVGYIVLKGVDDLSFNEIRSFLRDKLSINMIPNFFVTMEEFPLSPSGKIDKKNLPLPQLSPLNPKDKSKKLTPLEENVKSIFLEVFNIKGVSIEEDFFELGGHSLLAIKILSRIREMYNKEISVEQFFDSPNIQGLAYKIQSTEELLQSESYSKQDAEDEVIDIDNLSEEEIDMLLKIYEHE